ncbi:MAG: class I SAM-dependent methyltransferase [Halioglobus sp.]
MNIKNLPADIHDMKGFLAEDEAEALYRHAQAVSSLGPVLEIGSYCGKSTIYLGLACRDAGATVFALDHHRGSEEHQKGEFFHDPDLYDANDEVFDTFREFRRNIGKAQLNDIVVPVVSDSETAARQWQTELAMVFIDGGHSLDAALTDYRCWMPHLVRGGILAIHDLFEDAHAGGQAPYAVYRMARASGLFEDVERVNSLGVLRRL